MSAPFILNFSEIDREDVEKVGGKGANLGEMKKASFPVPDGFVVTTGAYDCFLRETVRNSDEIYKELSILNPYDTDELEKTAFKIRRRLTETRVPDEIANVIFSFYQKLTHGKSVPLAVRSSATAEDAPGTSFAGQQETYLNVVGEANLINKIRDCWASLFTARSIFYRFEKNIPHEKVSVAVVVQRMVGSEVSGIIFTVDPVTGEKDKIVIEAVWGLGELIVQGAVSPDKYVVQKDTFDILSKEISDQDVLLTRIKGENKKEKVSNAKKGLQKISDSQIVELAKIAAKIEKHYYFPQDIEWALERKILYIVQTRPITTLDRVKGERLKGKSEGVPILSGLGASPGVASGPVAIIKSPKEIGKIAKGDVLVAPMTSPDFVPAMKKAVAIITDRGGITSHASIVSREIGVPCIVGTKNATKVLKEGAVITVNGQEGTIFAGGNVILKEKTGVSEIPHTKTATKLYVNLAEPDQAKKIASLPVDGIGLLRAEFMVAQIGLHPKEALAQKKQGEYVKRLENGITTFCEAFGNRPVVYRATDFKTNEFRNLVGGERWEPKEENPLLGFRGAFRYITQPEVFNLELIAIANVRKKHKNLILMIPFVRSPHELSRVRKIVESRGLFESSSFRFWMMVELPVNVILINEFIKVGIDGVSIGSNDLTMLIGGVDRDNAEVSRTFDERNPAVLASIKRVIAACHKHGIPCSVCGQAPSIYEEFSQKLVEYGITSISVNPDAIARTKEIIISAEKKL